MKRWWTLPVLPAVVFGLSLPSAASASTHCTVSIIMTTLGTDGSSVAQTITVPPNSNLSIQTGGPATDSAVPSPAAPKAPTKSPSGGGSGGGGGGSGSANAPQSAVPSGASGNPADLPTGPINSVPVPTDGSNDEPTPPAPPVIDVPIPVPGPGDDPVVVVDVPVVDDTPLPPTTDDPTPVAEAPEPGTLTLLGLAAAGGLGYARRKRKSA